MAKIYGLFGAMTGKLADTVMSVRNGEQIARKYQPVVFNPSTPAQVAQRAKLKLSSQLAAVLAPVIAIPRVGSVSSRNMFTKVNFPLFTYDDEIASVTLASIQLTKSDVALPPVTLGTSGSYITAQLGSAATGINRVVYVVLLRQADNKLRLYRTAVISVPGTGNNFPWEDVGLPTGTDGVILAYGMRDNNENATARYGNMQAMTAETIAKLIVTRTLLQTDVTLTETVGRELTVANS